MARSYTLVEIIEILTMLIGDYEEEMFDQFKNAGITVKQAGYLEAINALGNPNQVELAGKLGLSKPSVTAIVDKLVALGFVKKTQSDEDRRSFHLHLTEKGEKITRMHDEIHRRIADLLVKNLSKDDEKLLVELLNKVVLKI